MGQSFIQIFMNVQHIKQTPTARISMENT